MAKSPAQIISVREVAKRLKRTPSSIEKALREGTFPIGTCFQTEAGRFMYIIPLDAFERFMRGEIAGRKMDGGVQSAKIRH